MQRLGELSPQLRFYTLLRPGEPLDDGAGIALAGLPGEERFDDPQRLIERIQRSGGDNQPVAVIGPGVAAAERWAQRLLRAAERLQVILLSAPQDRRSLGERFGLIPIRARQVELLAADAPDLAEQVLAVGEAALQRHGHRRQLRRAAAVLGNLQPRPLDLTAEQVRRQLLGSLPLGIVVITAEGFVVEINGRARELLQVSGPDAAAPRHLADLLPHWEHLELARLPETDTLSLTRRGVRQHLRLTTAPLGEHGEGRVVMIEDVTEQEEARRILEAVTAELEARSEQDALALHETQRQRDSIKHFIATLTHDLRSPVAAAMLSNQLLQRRRPVEEDPSARQLLQRVQRNLERVESMVEDLLDITRHDIETELVITPAPTRLDVLLRETLEEVQALYGKPVQISGELPPIEGVWDPEGLRRIIENLASNALKYGDPARPVEVWLRRDGDAVALAFRNYGPPIPPASQKVIFEPFYRAHAPAEGRIPGWGIGLAFVRAMTEAHGGSVSVASAAEYGTVFTVTLPQRAA